MARSSLSSNLTKWFRRWLGDPWKNLRRQIRRGVRHPRLAWSYQAFRRAIERTDWPDAHRRLRPLAEAAERARDEQLLTEMGFSAERLGEHELSNQLHVACARMSGSHPAEPMALDQLADATLAIHFMRSEKQGLAVGLNMGGYVAAAAKAAAHCALVVEPRLVPIFQRTLPEVDVRPFPTTVEAREGTRLVEMDALRLKETLGTKPENITNHFMPLRADQATADELRDQYRGGRDVPVIGISWWSSHFGKDLPSLAHWSDFLSSMDAVFVNLQYGDVAQDIATLQQAAKDRFIHDESVDQLRDMDRFAAQLAALDAVVTISNTGAHLTGAMGIPCHLIRDDWFRRAWPVLSDSTPWYPQTKVYGKNGRPWPEVLARIRERLTSK